MNNRTCHSYTHILCRHTCKVHAIMRLTFHINFFLLKNALWMLPYVWWYCAICNNLSYITYLFFILRVPLEDCQTPQIEISRESQLNGSRIQNHSHSKLNQLVYSYHFIKFFHILFYIGSWYQGSSILFCK